MLHVEKCPVPAHALLARYLIDGSYTDCYRTEIPGQIFLAEFVFAFYTTFIFKLERYILRWTVNKPSTDAEVRQLADRGIEHFAAWHVEDRSEHELLMCDFIGRTRSWLRVEPMSTDSGSRRTRLYFGSAVVPNRGQPSLAFRFRALLGFHKIYSVVLLYSATLRLLRRMKKENG